MRGLALAAALALAASAAPVFAQPPKPAPAQPPKPAPTPPAQPAPAPPPVPAPQPPAPFPQGAKIAIVNLQLIASLSAEGKASAGKVQALIQKRQQEAAEKQKQIQANQQKLQAGGSIMNDAARTQLEKEIEREQVEAQRFQQDSQAEVNELQQELQQTFQKKLFPVLEELSKEKQLQMLLSVQDAGVIWHEPGIDLTMEAVKRLDTATAKPAGRP